MLNISIELRLKSAIEGVKLCFKFVNKTSIREVLLPGSILAGDEGVNLDV